MAAQFSGSAAMRRTAIAATLFLSAIIVPAQAGPRTGGGEVDLGLDEVHTLTFRSPVATVYVGNPTIADITMVDSRHAFVQGKGYGRTNIVALNQNGNQVFGTFVNVVGADHGDTVVLNRGAQRVTYSCTERRCEPTPMPGDGKDSFEAQNTQIGVHQDAARKAAATGG
jgi:Flp pilus assembly secretin CpaC